MHTQDLQIRICELLIQVGDVYSADSTYRDLRGLKSFGSIANADRQEQQFLEMRFRLVEAQFWRHLGKHGDAGHTYFSYINHPKLLEFPEQREAVVGAAIVCAVLARQPAKRASLLANLNSSDAAKQHRFYSLI